MEILQSWYIKKKNLDKREQAFRSWQEKKILKKGGWGGGFFRGTNVSNLKKRKRGEKEGGPSNLG